LESRGWLEIGALLAAMQGCAALRARATEVRAGRKRRGAIEATRRRDRLDEPRQSRAGHIDRRPGSLRPGAFLTPPAFMSWMMFAAGILVAALVVLTFAVHMVLAGLTPSTERMRSMGTQLGKPVPRQGRGNDSECYRNGQQNLSRLNVLPNAGDPMSFVLGNPRGFFASSLEEAWRNARATSTHYLPWNACGIQQNLSLC